MRNWRVRPMTPEDEERATSLLMEVFPDEPSIDENSFSKLIRDPEYDEEASLVAVSGDAVVGLAGGSASPDDSRWRDDAHIKVIAVSPGMRRRGVGTEMLGRLVERFRSRGKKIVRVVKHWGGKYFFPGVPVEYEGAVGFFLRNGFERDEVIKDVALDLDAYEPHPSAVECREKLAGEGVCIVPFEGGMLPGMRTFVERANAPNWYPAGWDERMGTQEDVWYLVARRRDGEILGSTACGLEKSGAADSWFGMIFVLPDQRGRGIGRVLLHEACEFLKGRGLGSIWAGWARVPFYLRNGWHVSREYQALQKRIT